MKNHPHLRRMRVWAIMFVYGAAHWQIPKAKQKHEGKLSLLEAD